MRLNGAHIIMEVLREQSVDTVFGYPGNAVLDIYDALNDCPDIQHILTAHEQGAAHAADGYARASGKTGVVIATSGPGASNLVTGIAAAYMDSSPIVAITGNVRTSMLGHDGFQEVDISGITMPITKYSFIVADIDELANDLREAFRIASTGRKGPVLVDIPLDILAAETDYEKPVYTPPVQSDLPPADTVQAAVNMLVKSKKPLLYIGGGVISANASQRILALAEKAEIPVVSSLMGLGAMPSSHPLFLGMVGIHGEQVANYAVHECDLLIAAGTRFSERVAYDSEGFAHGAEIIHIDIDPAEMDKNFPAQVHIKSDLNNTFIILTEFIEANRHIDWMNELYSFKNSCVQSDAYDSIPCKLLQTVHDVAGDDAIIVTDVGQHQMWTAKYYPFEKPRTFLTSGGLGAMGFGMGAAIGAKLAQPDKHVVLITGDGSFHMNCNELVTVARYKLPITIIIMNNGVLGMVRQQQWFRYGRFSQTEPERKTSFISLARAYGVQALGIKKRSQIKRRISLALTANDAVVADCEVPSSAMATITQNLL